MAQELTTMRSPAAYTGVTAYARAHSGEAASAAYLALGHAYLLDHRYPDAVASFKKVNVTGKTLDDYADFLGAQAEMESGKLSDAETLLTGFAAKYPESIFVPRLPVMIANLSLDQNDPKTALRVLHEHEADAVATHADFLLALARANQMTGSVDEAARLYRHIFLSFPLSNEGQQAKAQLAVIRRRPLCGCRRGVSRTGQRFSGIGSPRQKRAAGRCRGLRPEEQAADQSRSGCSPRYAG
jgi:soluble lytic murein transglycosylase